MIQGLSGWHLILFLYPVLIAVAIFALYFLVRLAVFHALKAHTKWIDKGSRSA